MADPVPLGQPLGFVPIKSLTSDGGPSVLSNAAGLGFVSPSLNPQPGVNKIDIKSFSVTATPSDKYSPPPGSNRRPWLWGPPPVIATISVSGAADDGFGLVEITTTAPHGLSSGSLVFIDGVIGTTEANGGWTILSTGANTFTLSGSAFVNAYISGGTVLDSPPFPPVYNVGYEPVLNAGFCFLKTTQRSAIGVMTDTTGPPVSVVILY